MAWALSFKDKELVVRVQKAQNACIYFERLKQNRLNYGYARFLTGFGKSNDIPVLYIQGLECLLANYLQSASITIGELLRLSIPTLKEYLETGKEGLENQRIQELLDGINVIDTSIEPSGCFEKAREYVSENKLSELLQLLNEYPVLAKEVDANGFSLLMRAIQCASQGAVELLLSKGADHHHCESTQDSTALLLAVNLGHQEITRLLIENGSDIEVKGIFGQTPLIRSIIEQHYDVIALLLEFGAITDRKDNFGRTALMYAIEDEEIEIINSLLFAGADLAIKDENGKSCLELAEETGNKEVVEAIKQFQNF